MAYTPTKWQDHIPGVQDGTPVSAAAMNKIENGIAAADVGAVKLRWSTLINETTATPGKYNFNDYITPGDVISVDNYASAQSVANIPETVPGKLYVLPLRTDDQGRNDLMQQYHTVTGNIHCRSRYYYSGNKWAGWDESWITPTLMSPFYCIDGVPVKYARINNLVVIRGWLRGIKDFADVFTLQPGYRPQIECNFIVPQSESSGGNGTVRIIVKPSGVVSTMSMTYYKDLDYGCGIDVVFPLN